jgi:hypothetical protein
MVFSQFLVIVFAVLIVVASAELNRTEIIEDVSRGVASGSYLCWCAGPPSGSYTCSGYSTCVSDSNECDSFCHNLYVKYGLNCQSSSIYETASCGACAEEKSVTCNCKANPVYSGFCAYSPTTEFCDCSHCNDFCLISCSTPSTSCY